jgi:hypothetical protein
MTVTGVAWVATNKFDDPRHTAPCDVRARSANLWSSVAWFLAILRVSNSIWEQLFTL